MNVITKIINVQSDGTITEMALEAKEGNNSIMEVMFSRHDCSESFQMRSGKANCSDADIICEAIQLILFTFTENGEDNIDIITVNERKLQVAI